MSKLYYLFIICSIVLCAHAQTPAPTPNVTIPNQATLRPTVSTAPSATPTMMMVAISSDETSGEPSRSVVAIGALIYCIILTILGVGTVVDKERYDELRPPNIDERSSSYL